MADPLIPAGFETYNKPMGFIIIDGYKFPYPSKDSGLQGTYTIVDASRNANGQMVGERIGRDQAKIELTWSALTATQWSSLLKIFKKFTFKVKYIDQVTNDWKERTFYVGDRTAQPFLIAPVTNRPKYYLNCQSNIIDVGIAKEK